MIFKVFQRSANKAVIGRLYAGVVESARQPSLFSQLGISDTIEGRFESLTLHASLVLRRLNALPPPGPDMAQDLVDAIFRHFDAALREMGTGDTVVPKRMKRLAESFMGRSAAYDRALHEGTSALESALKRNIFGEDERTSVPVDPARMAVLVRYVEAAAEALTKTALADFMAARLPFPDPSSFFNEALT